MSHPNFERKVSELVLPHDPITCRFDETITSVLERMKEKKIGSVVAVENNIAVGIITERDFLLKLAGTNIDFNKELIGNYMVKKPVGVKVTEPIRAAVCLMRLGRFRHLIVNDENGKFLNVISVKDVIDFLTDSFELSIKSRS